MKLHGFRQALILLTAAACAAVLCSCGDSGSLWDYSAEPTPLGLLDGEEISFTGNEWTGNTLSKDAKGNFVSQSDIVRVGNLEHHTVGTVVYDSAEKAAEGAKNYDRTLSPYYKLLTGGENVWQLAVYKNTDDAEAAGVLDNFYRTDYNMSAAPVYEGEDRIYSSSDAYYGGFKDVTLPASWQTQGFDFPIYTNTVYPWADGAYGNEKRFPPDVPTVTNPVGFYRFCFDVDPEWINTERRVYISFGGVESAYYVYINGHAVGYSEDTFDACDFDITPYLNPDGRDNLLAVRVHRWCDGSYFENQDFMRLAGIFRDVYLYSTPALRISDYTVVTDPDKSYTSADINLTVEISNTSATAIGSGDYSVYASLFDADGNEAASVTKSVPAAEPGENAEIKLSKKVSEPRLWSDEDPYLYTLVITLYEKNGAYLGSLSQQLGIREIEFTPTEGTTENESYSQVLLNGKPLILKGVDRHEMNPETGRYISPELEEKDVKIMKSLNINAVRTSHYPDSESFYDMCDRYGILVLGECNIETHYNVSAQDTETYFKEVIRDRVEAHTMAYKNRTCIIIWSIGNETIGGSETFINLIQELKQRDPTRPVHFESQGSGGGVDIASSMYSSVDDVNQRGNRENHMPYLMCEYAHAMGNSVGNLYEYWEVFRKYDNILGGFIWDFVDQAIWTEIPSSGYDYYGNGKYLAYGGSWGDNPNSGDFCQNGIISADRTVQPEAYEVKYVYQPVWFTAENLSENNRTVSIYNEFRFRDLSEFDIGYEILKDGEKAAEGVFEGLSCAPLETVTVDLPEGICSYGEGEYLVNLYCKLKESGLWADAGYIIAQEQLELSAESSPEEDIDISGMPALTVSETEEEITLTNTEGLNITISKKSGTLNSYSINGDVILCSGPVTDFKRAHLSNDNLGSPLSGAGIDSAENLEYSLSDGDRVFTMTAKLNFPRSTYEDVSITVYGDGTINYSGKLNLSSEFSEIYRYGVNLTLPADFEEITYYGRGPADTYCDRKRGSLAGIYSQTVSESFFPYGNPQDTGNKTDVRYFTLENGSYSVKFSALKDNGLIEASALHYTAADLERARAPYQLKAEPEYTYLCLSYKNRGTGGASCGPEPLDQYKVKNTPDMEYGFTISVEKK